MLSYCTRESLYSSLTDEALGEGHNDILELGLEVLAESTLLVNGSSELSLIGLEVLDEISLPLEDPGNRNGVEVTVDTSVDERNHLVNGHGRVLLLLEELGQLYLAMLVCCNRRDLT